MRKTQRRRKLYGKSRRRQRGGGARWWVLLGALGALNGATAEQRASLGEVARNWWYNPNPLNPGPSIELANRLAEMETYMPSFTFPSSLFTATKDPNAYAPPSEEEKEHVEKVVEPYLLVDIKQLKDGGTYEYNGQPFQMNTWRHGQVVNEGKFVISTYDLENDLVVPVDAKFKVITPPPSNNDYNYEGGRRRQRRKTLRRKK